LAIVDATRVVSMFRNCVDHGWRGSRARGGLLQIKEGLAVPGATSSHVRESVTDPIHGRYVRVREGDVLGGTYRLGSLVGEGAMGHVYRARHLVLGHEVAIKVLNQFRLNRESRARFLREAQATMRLQSEHIVRVFDLGVIDENVPFMALELLEGSDLRSTIEARGSLPVDEAVDHVLQVCEGLADAHCRGIVHRDIKPQNIFVTRRANGLPLIKILDFGISKILTDEGDGSELTGSEIMLGTPAYCSPEQLRNPRTVDARTDIWSLGVVLHALLGGGRAFTGETPAALVAAIIADEPHPLPASASVPEELGRVIRACLQKSPADRPQSAVALSALLLPFASPLGRASAERLSRVHEPPRPYAPSPRRLPAPNGSGEETKSVAAPGAPRRRRRLLVLGIAAAVALSIGAARWKTRSAGAAARSAPIAELATAEPLVAVPEPVLVTKTPQAAPPPKTKARHPHGRPAAAVAPDGRPAAIAAPEPPTASSSKARQLDRNGVPILD
jgi:eukaryotic-like serine/threonine-protein kinase